MKQKRITSTNGLLAKSAAAIEGAHNPGVLLTRNTASAIAADRASFSSAVVNHKQSNADLAARRDELHAVLKSAREFAKTTRDLLKRQLGSRYSEQWAIVGFTRHSIQLPRTTGELLTLVEQMQSYLLANPRAQVRELDITPAYAATLVAQLKAAQGAVNSQVAEVTQLQQARHQAKGRLRKRMRDLVLELRQELDPVDGRWHAFQLNRPGAKQIPDVPGNVTVVAINETSIAAKWGPTARAEYFRAWKRVVGVDRDFVHVGSPTDRDFTFENLPREATIELAFSAVNNGGESARSIVARLTIKATPLEIVPKLIVGT